jgi:hypothetical protein
LVRRTTCLRHSHKKYSQTAYVVGGPTRNPSKTKLVSPVQTIAQRANLLGLSEDRYLNDYVDAEELNGSD